MLPSRVGHVLCYWTVDESPNVRTGSPAGPLWPDPRQPSQGQLGYTAFQLRTIPPSPTPLPQGLCWICDLDGLPWML